MGWQLMQSTGDTKAGTLIAKDRYGNKYYENLEEELPCEPGLGTLLMPSGSQDYSAHKMGGL